MSELTRSEAQRIWHRNALLSEHFCSDSIRLRHIFLHFVCVADRMRRRPTVISVDSSDEVLREAICGDLCKKLISENSLSMSQTPAH
jgi:hypothetical protein